MSSLLILPPVMLHFLMPSAYITSNFRHNYIVVFTSNSQGGNKALLRVQPNWRQQVQLCYPHLS